MYKIKILNFEKKYLLEELIKIFLRPDQYYITEEDEKDSFGDIITFNEENYEDRNEIKRQIYDRLADLTGRKPEWGILTGIRPVKLCGEYFEKCSSKEKTIKYLKEKYYIESEKAKLLMDMYMHQINTTGRAEENSVGVYLGIPFCPTRCIYCSFASNQVSDEEISRYIRALQREIVNVGSNMKKCDMYPETIYIGGGTPTILTENQLRELIRLIRNSFDLSKIKEFSVEAGRPDTITDEKLGIMKENGVNRISINPQTMKDDTLRFIGRHHSAEETKNVFKMAACYGFDSINADVIAGLPRESLQDFEETLKQVISMGADNITVHSLAVKRASGLIDIDRDFHYKQAEIVSQMLELSRVYMRDNSFIPYYLYRQKHMAGAYENTGYCKKGKECIYNIRIMDEHQSIIALGAGGISKIFFPEENRLERVPNVSNYEEYINRTDEMIERKNKEIWEVKKC